MALQERRDHEIALRLAEETGGGVEELTPSLKRSSSGEKIHTRYERVFSCKLGHFVECKKPPSELFNS